MNSSQTDLLKEVIDSDRVRPFFAGLDDGKRDIPRLTMHTVQPVSKFFERRRLAKVLRERGAPTCCAIRHHSQKSLSEARSLEAFVRPFRHTSVVSDPTGSMRRALNLVAFSRALRRDVGDKLLGTFLDTQRQLLFVVLDYRRFFSDKKVKTSSLARIEEAVSARLKSELGDEAQRYIAGVKLGFELPAMPLVAIDEISQTEKRVEALGLRTKTFVAALGAMIGLGVVAGTATAADVNREGKSDPAVSAPNFDVGLLGGVRDGEEIVIVEGAATLPIGHSMGFRLDGTAGVSNNEFTGGTAGHLFWRDPAIGLVGVQGGFFSNTPDGSGVSEEFGRIGGFAELYIEDFTLLVNAGGQFGDSHVKDGFYGGGGLEWFATDNLMFHVMGEYDPERDGVARFGVEYLPGLEALPGLSFYVEGAVGGHNYERVLAGFRIHFGAHGQRSLKDRYRFDTFRNTLMSTSSLDTPTEDPEQAASYVPPVM